jgi:four helix bundle protein
MTLRRFEDIEAWQVTRELAAAIYVISGTGLFAKDRTLRDQARRAAVSALSNIAEGFERQGTAEFVQFLSVAKGSLGELRSQLYLARDLGYLGTGEAERLLDLNADAARLVGGLMRYLRGSQIRGTKFKTRDAPPRN